VLFQFDAECYQEWVAELAVWVEDRGEGERTSPYHLQVTVCNRAPPDVENVTRRSRGYSTTGRLSR